MKQGRQFPSLLKDLDKSYQVAGSNNKLVRCSLEAGKRESQSSAM